MHYTCYLSAISRASRENGDDADSDDENNVVQNLLLCPLCRSLTNILIPTPFLEDKPIHTSPEMPKAQSFDDFLVWAQKDTLSYDANTALEQLMHTAAKNIDSQYAVVLEKFKAQHPNLEPDENFERMAKASFAVAKEIVRDKHPGEHMPVDVIRCISATLADLEISLRGEGYENGTGNLVVHQMKDLSFSTAKTLVRFGSIFIAIMNGNEGRLPFVGSYANFINEQIRNNNGDLVPIIANDQQFDELVYGILLLCPSFNLDPIFFIRAYFIGAIITALQTVLNQIGLSVPWTRPSVMYDIDVIDKIQRRALESLRSVVEMWASELLHESRPRRLALVPDLNDSRFPPHLYTMILKIVTPYLRRAAILVAVMGLKGTEPTAVSGSGLDSEPEANKLCDFLGIPRFDDVLKDMCTPGSATCSYIAKWHERLERARGSFDELDRLVSRIEYPNVVKLISLPNRLDEFFRMPEMRGLNSADAATPGQSQVQLARYNDPAICLFCGGVTFVQSHGGMMVTSHCHVHAKGPCGGGTGIFLLPKQCSVLLWHNKHGIFMPAPYLDLHGESDDIG